MSIHVSTDDQNIVNEQGKVAHYRSVDVCFITDINGTVV